MANYAIIIGIDGYSDPRWTLCGAVTDALNFTRWATGTGGVPADDAHLRLLLSPAPGDPAPMLPPGVTSAAATGAGIRLAMKELRRALPEGGGERLYFYFAGHGASLPQWKGEPILIPVDFSDPEVHAHLPLGFSDVLPVLGGLRFTEQLFFIDACRDFALPDFQPAVGSAIRLAPEQRGPRQYVLYSVAPGQRAAETGAGIWTGTLLEGLGGTRYQPLTRGRGPDGRPRYEVRLDRLAEWLCARVGQRIQEKFLDDAARFVQTPEYDKDPKGGNPLLLTFTPEAVPRARLEVMVAPDVAYQTCKIQVMEYVDARGEEIELDFKGPPIEMVTAFELRPSDYSFRAQADRFVLQSKVWTVDDDPVIELTLAAAPAAPDADRDLESTPAAAPAGPDADLDFAFTLELEPAPVSAHRSRGGAVERMRDVLAAEPDGDFDFALPVNRGPAPGPRRPHPVSPAGPPAPVTWGTSAASGTLCVVAADPLLRIDLLDAGRQLIRAGLPPGQPQSLAPGIYRVRLRLPGLAPRDQTVEVRPHQLTQVQLDLPDPKLGRRQLQILKDLDIAVADARGSLGYLFPSARLGPVAGASLASLLAYAAFAVNQPDQGDVSKLRAFGVAPFLPDAAARCGLLTLVGAAAKQDAELSGFLAGVRLSVRRPDGTLLDQGAVATLAGMPAAGQRQCAFGAPGSLEVELQLPGFARTRYALTALPGRLMVFVVVVEGNGAVEVQQYLLRVHGLASPEPPWVRGPGGWPADLRRLELAQRFYAAGDPGSGLVDGDLEMLLWGKCLDPLMGCIAGYSLARSGEAAAFAGVPPPPGVADILDHLDDPRDPVAAALRAGPPGPSALRNLLCVFPDLPDAHVLAALCDPDPARRDGHFARVLRHGLPLFAAGTRALAAWFLAQQASAGAAAVAAAPGPAALPAALREPLAGLLSGTPWTAWAAVPPAAGLVTGMPRDGVGLDGDATALATRADGVSLDGTGGRREPR